MTRLRGALTCALLIAAAACSDPGETAAEQEAEVGASEEALVTRAYTSSLSITRTGTHSITLSYDCSGFPREIWRRMGDQAFRKIADLPRCSGRGTFVDDDASPVRPYCYRLRRGDRWIGSMACGRTRYVSCGGEGRPWQITSCPRGDCTVRVQPGSCLDIRGSVKLDPRATYDGVEVRFRTSDATLDCQGATLSGPYDAGTGITVTSPWTAQANPDVELASCAEPPPEDLCQYARPSGDPGGWDWQDTVDPLRNVRIEDCTVDGYRIGAKVELQGAWHPYTTAMITAEYERWFRHPTEQQCRVGQIEDCLRDAAPRDVTFHGVHIRDSGSNGLHLRSYVHDITFEDGSVHDAGAVGAYVTSGSRDNVIRDSSFRNNDREGIALDASAFNLISGNTLVGNSKRWLPEWEQPYGQAITVFRNAWENRWSSDPSGPRLQHAEGNVIERNEIRDHQEAIWIGFRQSTGRHSSDERGDPIYFTEGSRIPGVTLRYYRKNAEDTVVRWNTISDFDRGVVVEDDRARIIGNWFTESGSHFHIMGVDVGSRVRSEAREPVYGADVEGNVFNGEIHTPIWIHDCSYGNYARDNWRIEDGAWSRVNANYGSCRQLQANLVGHFTGADGEIPERSFAQRGGFFQEGLPWVAGDVDADGLSDVVSIQQGSDSRVRIWLHASTGRGLEHRSSFQTFEPARIDLGFLSIPVPVAAGRWLMGDIDGLRGDDLAFIYGYDETRVRVWMANGRGFEDPSDHLLSDVPATEPRLWLAGDVSGDGRADLVAVHDDGGGSAAVDLHRSVGNGRFRIGLSQVLGAWNDEHHFLLGDVTGDDRADLVRVFEGSGGKAIAWAHRSAGTSFTHAWLAWVSTTGSSGGAIEFEPEQQWHLADVNGDGRDDVVAVWPIPGITMVFEARAIDGGLAYHHTTLIPRELGDAVWLAGRFDCGAREDFVTVEGSRAWGRPRDFSAPPGPACGPVVGVGTVGVATTTATMAP